ncbi:MAG TPA: hypothetical protein VMU33_11090 [Burkholderiaceae bacterium]|nr:hypothetical protein [Burkholderiaceae bacterium]
MSTRLAACRRPTNWLREPGRLVPERYALANRRVVSATRWEENLR